MGTRYWCYCWSAFDTITYHYLGLCSHCYRCYSLIPATPVHEYGTFFLFVAVREIIIFSFFSCDER